LAQKRIRKNHYKRGRARRRFDGRRMITAVLKAVCGLGALVLMSGILIFGYDVMTQCEYFQACRIDVRGIGQLSRSQVLRQARIDEGANILSVNLKVARKRLLAHPWIREARVTRVLPTELDIVISEHRPFAVVDLGKKFLIDTRGELFKRWEAEDPDQLPVIEGLEFFDIHEARHPRSRNFDAVMRVLNLGRSPDSILPNRMIKRIQVDPNLGISVYAYDENKVIHFGYHDYPDKYQRLKQILSYVDGSSGIRDFIEIDLNSRDRVVLHPVRAEVAENHKEV